jgi:hypothetical protein
MSANPFHSPAPDLWRCCRVVSWYHLDDAALAYLGEATRRGTKHSMSHHIFLITPSTIGFQLIGTPWDTTRPCCFQDFTAEELRQAHLEYGIPPSLVDILHLAGEAGLHYLIFDGNAPEIDGLPVYD